MSDKPRPIGRPRRSATAATDRITLRLTKAERAGLEHAAGDLAVSDWIRDVALAAAKDVVAPALTGTVPKRAPRISTEAAAKRRPLPPQTLLQQELPVKQPASRLLASKPIKVKRNG
jgi:uncharacterized protein (DUF1778 family)